MRNKKLLIKYGTWSILAVVAGYMAMKFKEKLYKSDDYKRHLDHDLDDGAENDENVKDSDNFNDKFKKENKELQECVSFLKKLTQLGVDRGSKVKLKNYSDELNKQADEASNELKEFCNKYKLDFTEILSSESELKLKDYNTLKNKDIDDLLIEDYITISEKTRGILLKLKDKAKSDLMRNFYQKMIQKNDTKLENIVANIS